MSQVKKGIRLDWSGEMMPHAVLDLLRGCNSVCEGCYNATSELELKPLAQILEEFEVLRSKRRLQAISLTGGEPLLHPDLDTIIQAVKATGIRSVLMSNGILLDEKRAAELKTAGLDMVLLHIQKNQIRPDTASFEAPEQWSGLRRQKAEIARKTGLDIGFSAVLYSGPEGRTEINTIIQEVVGSENVHFIMLCPQCDFSVFSKLAGDLKNGYSREGITPRRLVNEKEINQQADVLYELMDENHFAPFTWIGSSCDENDPRWSSWNAGVLKTSTSTTTVKLFSGRSDRMLIRLYKMISGRYPIHITPNKNRFRLQLFLSFFNGTTPVNDLAKLFLGSFNKGATLQRKHIMIELTPAQREDGTVVFCRECIEATASNGKLVPPCLIDRMKCQ